MGSPARGGKGSAAPTTARTRRARADRAKEKAAPRRQKQAPPSGGPSPWPTLLAVGAVALAVRLLYLWQIRQAPFFALRLGDGEAYHLWAQRLASGDWLGQGVFYQAPLYPYFLGVLYRLVGDSTFVVRVVHAVLGAVACVVLARAGQSMFGRRGAAIAGMGLALYPPAIFLEGLIDKTVLVTLLVSIVLALLAAAGQAVSARRGLGLGIALGLLALARENALVLVVPILIWVLWRPSTPEATRGRPGWKAAAALLAGLTVVLLPVAVRNLTVGGELALTTSQLGPNLYIGNHARASGTYEPLVQGHGSAQDEREDATRLAEAALGRPLRPREVSAFWRDRVIDFVRAEPAAWLKLMARKLALTLNAAEMPDTETPELYKEWSWLLRGLRPYGFGVLLTAAALAAGLAASRRPFWLYALAGTYTLSVALFYVFARYRLPLAPMLILASAGLGRIPDVLRAAHRRTLAGAAAAAVVAAAFAWLPMQDEQAARATQAVHCVNLGTIFARDMQRTDLGLEFYRRALALDPRSPAAHMGMGVLLGLAGKYEEAIPEYRAALAASPGLAEAHHNLGQVLQATGRFEEAIGHYREALGSPRLPPSAQVRARVGLADALTRLNRTEEAAREYEAALRLDPSSEAGRRGLTQARPSGGS